MLLKQLIDSPKISSSLLVFDPFNEPDRMALVKEVIGLANAAVDGPRYILFGINPAAMEGSGIVGIPERSVAELKKAHRFVSALVEPTLGLAFVFDQVNGKLVGALEIDDCDFGPYFLGQDLDGSLQRGQSWIREGRELRAVERSELQGREPAGASATTYCLPGKVRVSVGFNDDPDCDSLEMPVPDTSTPPFAEEIDAADDQAPLSRAMKGTMKDTRGTVTTQVLRLGQGSLAMMVARQPEGEDTGLTAHAGKILEDARNHYFFEERAVRLDLCIRNDGPEELRDLAIEFGFPRIPALDVADRLYASPFDKRSEAEMRNMGYPDVENLDDAIYVRSPIASLAGHHSQPVFQCPLRLAVGPGMRGRKLGITYNLRGPDGKSVAAGRVKIRFGEIAA